MQPPVRKPARRLARSKRDIWIEQRYGRAALEAEWARQEAQDAPRRLAASIRLGKEGAERRARAPKYGHQLQIIF